MTRLGTRTVLVPVSARISAHARTSDLGGQALLNGALGLPEPLMEQGAHEEATASHARGRWFETSRAHVPKSLLSGTFQAGRTTWDSPLRPVENGAGAGWCPIDEAINEKPSRRRLRGLRPWPGAGLLLCMEAEARLARLTSQPRLQ
jgi:hypothetical protein